MFTGLVKEIGVIRQIRPNTEGRVFVIDGVSLNSEIHIDDSVSVNGVCQTAVVTDSKSFEVQAVHTTLEKTSLGSLKIGDEVNLELAVRPMDRMGGHIVQGHVNGVGTVSEQRPTGKNIMLSLTVPKTLSKYCVAEGSVTLDGISLTIAAFERGTDTLTVAVIPHTWDNTVLKNRKIGDKLNIEVDILAKYVENLIFYGQKSTGKSSMSFEWLREQGF